MQTIHEVIQDKLKKRQDEKRRQQDQNAKRLDEMEQRIREIGQAFQCDECRITYHADNTVYAELIYYYDRFKKKFHCNATGDENGIKVYIFLDGQPIRITLSDADNMRFVFDKITDAIVNKIEYYRSL